MDFVNVGGEVVATLTPGRLHTEEMPDGVSAWWRAGETTFTLADRHAALSDILGPNNTYPSIERPKLSRGQEIAEKMLRAENDNGRLVLWLKHDYVFLHHDTERCAVEPNLRQQLASVIDAAIAERDAEWSEAFNSARARPGIPSDVPACINATVSEERERVSAQCLAACDTDACRGVDFDAGRQWCIRRIGRIRSGS
jgi:hypothetical protein